MVLDSISSFMASNHELVYVFSFIFASIEFIPVVGNVVPGTTILLFASFLASSANLNIYIMMALGFVGSFLADILSYFLGRHYRIDFIDKMEVGIEKDKSYNQWMRKSKWFSFIVLGKLNSLIRAFISYISGTRRYDFKEFVALTIIGDALWVSVYMALPYYLGKIAQKYVYFINGAALVIVFLILIVISYVDGTLKELWEKYRKYLD